MKQYIIFMLLTAAVTLIGCKKEEPITASAPQKNWFEIHDNPNDELDHRIYQVYIERGVPIFYNDLLGTENRGLDTNGDEIIFEFRLDLNYSINSPGNNTSTIQKKIVLSEGRSNIKKAVDFLDNVFLPKLPKEFYFHSILLLEEIYEQASENGPKTQMIAAQGMNTFAVSGVSAIALMDSEQLEVHSNKLLTYLAVQQLTSRSYEEILKFYDVSYDLEKDWSFYGMAVSLPRYPGYKCLPPDRWQVYGFLDYKRYTPIDQTTDPSTWNYTIIDKVSDVEDYIEAALTYSEEEFKAINGSYPKVMEKYGIMRKLIQKFGFMVK